MRLLLDTHAFLWFIWNDSRLSVTARTLIEGAGNEVFLSIASVWEIAIKVGTGTLSVGQDVERFLIDQMAANEIGLFPISVVNAAKVSVLPFHHKDPFDRLLVAPSLTESVPLVSADTSFDAYGVQRLR